jgi:hypothetical protein
MKARKVARADISALEKELSRVKMLFLVFTHFRTEFEMIGEALGKELGRTTIQR